MSPEMPAGIGKEPKKFGMSELSKGEVMERSQEQEARSQNGRKVSCQ